MRKIPFILLCIIMTLNVSSFAETEAGVRIGLIYPLTGNYADMGAASRNGIELAIKEEPTLFRNIQFVYEDSGYDGKNAVSAYQKLRSTDSVDLVYVWGDAPSEAVAPRAERDKFPLVASTTDASDVVGKNYVIRSHFDSEQLAEAIVRYLRDKAAKKVGIINVQIVFTDDLIANMRKILKTDESIEVIDNYLLTDTDFKASILKLKKAKYDALGVFVFGGQIPVLYRQLSNLGYDLPTFGSDAFENKTLIKQTNGLMSGAVFAQLPLNEDFVSRYFDKYENDHQISFAAKGYDFALLCGRLFGQVQVKPTAEMILNAFAESGPQIGAVGAYHYTYSPEKGKGFRFPVVMKQIQGDKIIEFDSHFHR